MDLGAIWTMAMGDLRQRLRDRSVLIFALVVPIALMAVFNVLFSGVGSTDALDPMTVRVAADADDQVAGGLVEVLDSIDDLDITATRVAPTAARDFPALIEDEKLTAAVVFPPGFAAEVTAGGSPKVELMQSGSAGLEAQVVDAIVSGYVDRVANASTAAAAAGGAGVPPDQLADVAQAVAEAEPLLTATAGAPASEQLSMQGYLVAGQAALFMFFTVGFGVIAYVQEREQGTLPRLQSMPFPPRSIIVAKAVVSFILGVSATAVLLVVGSLLFDVSFGSPLAVGALIVVAVAAVTSLVLLVTRVARTAEQAQAANAIVGFLMGVLGGSFFPIGGTGLLTRLSDLTPTAAFIRGLGITSGGGGIAELGGPFLVLAVFGGVLLLVAALTGSEGVGS
ncbi:MAG: ABC transporter permease [Microthrixaceae bacterium]